MSKRIINYPTITSISDDDYLLIANYNNELGKRKLLANKLAPSGEDLIGSASDWKVDRIESNASISWVNNQIVETWNGNFGNGGINVHKTVKIPASANKIKFKIVTGVYQGRNIASDNLAIGLRSSIDSGWVFGNNANFLVKKEYNGNFANSTLEDELDLSNIHSDAYLYIVSVMWNWTVTQLELF